ncbi:MAG TPA: DoxX family protein [Salinivirgaceae bacterium]|nr:DoxX family protein [Salinivirgaceae bacterium]HQA75580.1 DoxX family protein [Salinivirgaceae bacterium]
MWKLVVKILVGLVFIASAILKLITIDDFEIYIFTINLFSLDLSILLARLIIGFEFFLGMLLCLNLFKLITDLTIATTLVFTIYLLIRAIAGDTENCQCFGSNIFLSPTQSIVKNVVLIAGLVWARNSKYFQFKYKKLLSIGILVTSIVVVNILSPPDFLYYNDYSRYTDNYNVEYFEKFKVNPVLKERENKKTVICFFSTGCRLCNLTAKKISGIINSHNIDKSSVLYVFIKTDDNDISEFLIKNKSIGIEHIQLPRDEVLLITYGSVPIIILYDNEVIDSFIYRGIVEKNIVSFFKN